MLFLFGNSLKVSRQRLSRCAGDINLLLVGLRHNHRIHIRTTELHSQLTYNLTLYTFIGAIPKIGKILTKVSFTEANAMQGAASSAIIQHSVAK